VSPVFSNAFHTHVERPYSIAHIFDEILQLPMLPELNDDIFDDTLDVPLFLNAAGEYAGFFTALL
jgi:hypothetical protein